MNKSYVTVSADALLNTRRPVYHALGLWGTGPADIFEGKADGTVTSDGLTVCGLSHWRATWRVKDGYCVDEPQHILVDWPQIHVKHARRIGRPCKRCFPDGDDR